MHTQTKYIIYRISRYVIALVWLINGLFCKVFDLVPRHQQIVDRILNISNGSILTILIGISEVAMFIWIISGLFKKFNAITQVVVIIGMNILEYLLAKDLLLWGQYNLFYALGLCGIILYTEFILSKADHSNVTLS